MTPDIIINVRFLTPPEGGRGGAVQGPSYSCPLFVDNDGFDCRLLLDDRQLELGKAYEVSVKFLFRDKALPRMYPGAPIRLWEGRDIAQGQVVRICEEG